MFMMAKPFVADTGLGDETMTLPRTAPNATSVGRRRRTRDFTV
jgi:hypothetical protein